MSYRRIALAWAFCLAALAAGCSGCAGREETAAEEPDDSSDGLVGGVSGWVFPPSGTVIGQQDDANRYLATVSLRALSAPDGGHHKYRACSGVLVARNLALTAAHCVCAPSRDATTRFDGSGCATKATVHVALPRESDGAKHFTMDDIAGNILVHPRFEIVLDAQEGVVASHADLAVIRLEKPAFPGIRPVRLATEEVKAGEVLSVVGFGSLQQGGIPDFMRWFSREEVQTPAGDDRFLFGPLDRADYTGDTGGPCLRETKQGLELVGISQRGLDRTPTFTRTTPYRTWLEEQIRLADEKR